jgi:transcriptional regulator with XRE-family HTH domain
MSLVSAMLRKERLAQGVTQEELAKVANVSRTALASYESGVRKIPDDVLGRVINHLGSVELQSQKCWECEVNVFLLPLLDQVDRHPMAVRTKLIEELKEAVTALEELSLVNKLTAESLSEYERVKLNEVLIQILDVIPAIQLFVNAVAHHYDVPLGDLKANMYAKCRSKGYHSNPNEARVIKNAAPSSN